jgi:YjbE family integral membrane protein
MSWMFILGFLQIVVIDLALSADNALVIGMAAASLPRSQRTRAVIVGGACAIALRITLTSIVSFLLRITLLSAIAGAVLFWVAWKLLRMDSGEAAMKKTTPDREARNFRQAVLIILLADATMSLDNILAIAGASHGSIPLLVVGLLISMSLLITTGAFISRLIDRFKWIPFIGAMVITFTGVRMILEDSFIQTHLELTSPAVIIIAASVSLLFTGMLYGFNRRTSAGSGHGTP